MCVLIFIHLLSTEQSILVDDSLTVEIEFAAPLLLIPESSVSDLGCLKVDFGHVSVSGRFFTGDSEKSTYFQPERIDNTLPAAESVEQNMNMKSISGPADTFIDFKITNLSLSYHSSFKEIAIATTSHPQKYQDRKNTQNDIEYIFQPFGIDIEALLPCPLTHFNPDLAECNVNIVVKPKIELSLSALMYYRILYLSDIVLSTINSSAPKVEVANDKASSSFANAAFSALSETNSTLQNISSDLGNNEHSFVDEGSLKKSFFLRVFIPEILIVLIYDENSGHHTDISLTHVGFDTTDCLFETTLSLRLGALSLSDSKRSKSNRFLARSTKILSDQSHNNACDVRALFQCTVTSFKSKESPLFSKYGNEIKLRVGSLYLDSDALTLLNLRPFYEVSLGKKMLHYPPIKLNASTNEAPPQYAKDEKNEVVNKSSVPSLPAGVKLSLSLKNISLELFNPDDSCLNESNSCEVTLESVGKLEMIDLSVELCQEAERSCDIEKYRMVSRCDTVTKGTTNEMSAKLLMKSLIISDTRPTSEVNHYTAILCPRNVFSLASSNDELESSPIENQFSINFLSEVVSTVYPSHVPNDDEKIGPAKEEVIETTNSVNVNSTDVDIYVSLDAIMELLNVTMDHLSAITELTRPLYSDCELLPIDEEFISDFDDRNLNIETEKAADVRVSSAACTPLPFQDSNIDCSGKRIVEVTKANEIQMSPGVNREDRSIISAKRRKTLVSTSVKFSVPSPKL